MTQDAFKAWWYNEGSQAPYTHHDCEEHTMRMCEIAWNKAQALAQPEQPSVPWSAALESVWGEPEQEPVVHDPLPRACNLAGVDYQTFLKIKAYMPVAPPQPERHELQAKGEHPAPCAQYCEANAFQIVIKNLKAQLAQPEQEEKLPPVEIGVDVTDIGTTVVAFYRRPNAVMEMFYSQFHPLAQPEQEPVIDKSAAKRIATALGWTPQRKPLTDEEISEIAINNPPMVHEFARAIKQAHGIKE